MAKRPVVSENQANRGRKRARRGSGGIPEVTDVDSNKASRLESDRSPMQSSIQGTDHFPWNRLPHELRIKILRNLRPRDLDSCRLLNRETSELIRRNKRLLERSVIDHLWWSFTKTPGGWYNHWYANHFEEVSESSGPQLEPFHKFKSLAEIPTNTDVNHLELTEEWMTNEHLMSLSSRLFNVGCQVHTLEITDTCMAEVTSSVLLQFLRDIAAKTIILSIIECDEEMLSMDIIKFIISAPCFCINYFSDLSNFSLPLPIDDKILKQVTAHDFEIGFPNKITRRGLKSFIR
ncbi:F-box domain protein, partial [Ostertagia ostertagi]